MEKTRINALSEYPLTTREIQILKILKNLNQNEANELSA